MKERLHTHPPSLPEPRSAAQRRNRLTASLLTLALLLALTAIACAEQDPKIAFISDRDGNEDIYVMNADGSDVTRLTHTDGHIVCCPRWSPDGQRIAFTSNQGGNQDIYLVNADGSDLTQLTHSDRDDSNPAWSPDSQRIAFMSGRPRDLILPGALAMMNADGSDIARLLDKFDIYVVNADGSDLTQLTDDAGTDFAPGWSPDGQRIVFTSNRDGNEEIYLMNADGSGLTQLTHSAEIDSPYSFPVFSPDGQRILFYTWLSDGDLQMHMMNADGSGFVTQLIHGVEIESFHSFSFPVMSSDMRRVERIVSFSDRDGNDYAEIYMTNPDGSGLTQLAVAENYQARETSAPSSSPPHSTMERYT